MKAKRLSLMSILAAAVLIAAAYGSAFMPGGAPGWAAWAMAIGTAVMMVACTALGAARPTGLGPLRIPFALTLLILAGGFGLALLLPAETGASPLFLGLPMRAAIVLLGVGLLPLVVLPIAYAATFDAMTLSEADLEEVRRAAKAAQQRRVPASATTSEPAEIR